MSRPATTYRIRKNFGRIKKIVEIPNLVDIQMRSYDEFLQATTPADERRDVGLQTVFKSVFPIKDFNEVSSLEFIGYSLEKPKYDVDECRSRGMTYAAPLKVTIRLVVWDVDEETNVRSIRDVKEQEVYFGEIPLMTENGTFIINGTERVVVSQLHRSPGVFFDHDKGKTHSSGKLLYSARVIPYRGSWLDMEFDHKDILYVRIDRRRKMPVTVLLRALGYSSEQMLNFFYQSEVITFDKKKDKVLKEVVLELIPWQKASRDIKDTDGEIIVKKGRKFTKASVRKLQSAGIDSIEVDKEELFGRVIAHDVVDEATGEVVAEANQDFTPDVYDEITKRGINSLSLIFMDGINVTSALRDVLISDKIQTQEDSIIEIYKRLRPGDPPTFETAKNFFENLFFNSERYDLSKVGRLKINHKFGEDMPLEHTTLRREDVLHTVIYLINLKKNKGEIDDIDHLGNRRVRAVGELLENQYRIGLVRMERAIKERMSLQEIETLMPHDLINAKPVSAVIKEFFGSSQLSQFMDQTNPLSEVTHKRRLSALGPGGLTRERAGFEVRDVHPTHYGRICPIETPEGPNIGLIASLSTFARVNDYGFIETPYRKVTDGKVSSETDFYSALEEEKFIIAQANAPIGKDGKFENDLVSSRKGGDFLMVAPAEVDLMDVSPNQLVSVAASLVPFLENDDANRALMGANMQRQAVPLMRTMAPLVGTGIEGRVAGDSGVCVVAKRPGVIESVDASRIVVKVDDRAAKQDDDKIGSEVDIYNLVKFRRSNQNTCLNQKPIVKKGDRVVAGDTIADGPATDLGELALGQNVVVAFMPWGGYNFEDSILISEKVSKQDLFTSIHIEEFEVAARDTKLGKEEITRDIPNVGEEALADLDESGIIRIGAEVKPGDILVGKVTPKGETQLSPEEKLLRAIFGEKAGDVRDTSLRVPPGIGGTIIGAQIFSREGAEKDERAKAIQDQEVAKILKDQEDEVKIIMDSAYRRLKKLLVGKKSSNRIADDETGETIVSRGNAFEAENVEKIPLEKWAEISVTGEEGIEEQIEKIVESVNEQIDVVNMLFNQKIARLKRGDELPPGVIKMVKVYVAIKRKLQVGDKMAGRHGNKGVVSRILPEEDMPYLEDGTPVDVVLNPLGVPSRMNVGQILEVHLGWAAQGIGRRIEESMAKGADAVRANVKRLIGSKEVNAMVDDLNDKETMQLAKHLRNGVHVASPVFDGVPEDEIRNCLVLAELPTTGQATLFDGRTGDAFEQKVTVGVMYVLKLHHLVEDKIHARSIGPYSLVTQQPLGGKAQFGGQRLGEMEVWAMEAYGAAYCLQEFLSVKSDDVAGRTRMYEAIVKGENTLEPGLPESFNVLIKELQSLALNVELVEGNKDATAGASESGLFAEVNKAAAAAEGGKIQ